MTPSPRPGDPAITEALVAEHGLTQDEYARLVGMLEREEVQVLNLITKRMKLDAGPAAFEAARQGAIKIVMEI